MPFGSKTTSTSTSTAAPWSGAQPFITTGMQGAKDLLTNGSGFTPYAGQTVADFSPESQQAMGMISGMASQPNTLINAASGALTNTLNTPVNGGSQEFNNVLDYQAGKLTDDVNRGFSNAGRYGSGAHVGVLGQEVGNFRDSAMSQEIARQEGLKMQAAGLAPQIQAAQYAPAQMLAGVGDARDQRQQMQLDANQNYWDAQQNAPWNRLNAYTGAVSPYVGLGGTSTTTTQEPRRPFAKMLGFASSIAGMLSDARAKTDIEPVGETYDGEPLFKYKYRHDPDGPTHIGVLAQHLAQTKPEAVHTRPDGYLSVDYDVVT